MLYIIIIISIIITSQLDLGPISVTSPIAKVLERFFVEALITSVLTNWTISNLLYLDVRQLRLLSSLCTLF